MTTLGITAFAGTLLGDPDASTMRQTLGLEKQAAGQVAFFGMTTAPTGWLKANGAAVSRTSYSALFAVIGTTFGVGDGAATFNLPDLRGEFIRAFDDGRGVDSGRLFGKWQPDEMRSHTHTTQIANQGGGATRWIAPNSTDGSVAFLNTGAYGGSETRPQNRALLACIKY
ncbi:tail fiber protein [Martelella mediterranea]|nr:tail fiber protein [Martelella mediterranea]